MHTNCPTAQHNPNPDIRHSKAERCWSSYCAMENIYISLGFLCLIAWVMNTCMNTDGWPNNKVIRQCIVCFLCVCICRWCVLFTATKNGHQMLAVWRMVEKLAYSSTKKGAASDWNRCTEHKFIHLLTTTFKDLHVENSKHYKRWYCSHHTDCVSMCCWIISPFVIWP